MTTLNIIIHDNRRLHIYCTMYIDNGATEQRRVMGALCAPVLSPHFIYVCCWSCIFAVVEAFIYPFILQNGSIKRAAFSCTFIASPPPPPPPLRPPQLPRRILADVKRWRRHAHACGEFPLDWESPFLFSCLCCLVLPTAELHEYLSVIKGFVERLMNDGRGMAQIRSRKTTRTTKNDQVYQATKRHLTIKRWKTTKREMESKLLFKCRFVVW